MQSWPSISPTTPPSFANAIVKSTGIVVNLVTMIDYRSGSAALVDSNGIIDCGSEYFKDRFENALSSAVKELLPGNQQLITLSSTTDASSICSYGSRLVVMIVEHCSSGDCTTIGRTNDENGLSVWRTVQGLTTSTGGLLFQMALAGIRTREISIQVIMNDGYEVAFSRRSDTQNPTSTPSMTPSTRPSAFPTSSPSEWVPIELVDDGFYNFTGFGSCTDSDGEEYTNYLELKGDSLNRELY